MHVTDNDSMSGRVVTPRLRGHSGKSWGVLKKTLGMGRGLARPHVWRCGIPRCLGSSKSAPVHTSPGSCHPD